jgi:hypothetical protein
MDSELLGISIFDTGVGEFSNSLSRFVLLEPVFLKNTAALELPRGLGRGESGNHLGISRSLKLDSFDRFTDVGCFLGASSSV